ncbi:serologically defined colon cancer antigen 8 homolog isoform X2 [Danaus plexippus]|uniref:serologically defined colon cancer antigen 8 homolog isoform X2 n=1 Tax=Danaus plexippus TaxID=13037 RepID=UPI002AB231CC|nr:serologically defined colon cancer antigen 8 homolog isoform X2 [Danaus plexippus]
MGSTSFLKPRSSIYKTKSGSSAGSDKEMNVKLKRSKIRRPAKMNDYGMKRIPDYTEMAYKEAVSKLKYFLSGNNPPSVRSYGGSIKNLDESDGDLDKKYQSSYNNLSEYKLRPRLTSKYATLYADSLSNYNPPQATVNASNLVSQDVGSANPDVVNFIQKQEEYIEQLEKESQYCRDELNNLLGKVKEVISENEHLHEAQKNKIISRMFHSYNESETDDLDDVGDSTGLDSDSKISPSKSRKTRSRSTKLEGPNIVFESRISELEAQLTQSKIDLKKLQDENNEYKRKLANGLVDSTCLDGFKRQIDNLQRDKTALESQISKLKLSLEQKDGDFESKYKKGSDIIEQQLREERNNLETEIRRLKDELSSERAKNRSLAGEGARRAVAERSAAEQRYHQHCDELQRDLAVQYDYVAKLQLDLERQRREENDLKREISMKSTAIDELKMELKNKIASLQADLAQAHAEKASLEEELASARLAIERHQRQAKHETNRLNSEIQSVRQRLDRADADLVHSRRENLRLSEQISTLERELNLKNLTPISPEKKGKEKELSSMLETMENKHAPSTHAPITTRISNGSADAGFEHSGSDPSRNTPLRHHDNNTRNSDTQQNRDIAMKNQKLDSPKTQNKLEQKPEITPVPENNLTKQSSREFTDNNQLQTQKNIELEEVPTGNVENTLKEEAREETKQNESQEEKEVEKENTQTENSEEERPEEFENQNYTEQGFENYEQNYDQQQYSEQPAYSEQEFTENTEYPAQEYNGQQQYTEQYENYEQYTDPNTQYEAQQEYNYATDDNYGNQNYDNHQVSADYAPEYPDSATEQTESQESKTLDEKLTNQS